jgi:hypothetical protein
MSTLSLLDAIERPSILKIEPDERRHGRERPPRDPDGRDHHDRGYQPSPAVGGARTLDDLLTGIWETVAADQVATCPLCHGPMEPRHGAGAAPVGGRCTSCGTELS